MTVAVLGELSLGAAVPGAASAALLGVDGINASLPELQAKLTALLAVSPTPVSLALNLQLANDILAAVQAAIAAIPPLPPMPPMPTIYATTIAELTASVATLGASLAALASFQALLTTGGVAAYAYDGTRGQLGAELGATLGGGSQHANALVLYTEAPATWAAMGTMFKVTP